MLKKIGLLVVMATALSSALSASTQFFVRDHFPATSLPASYTTIVLDADLSTTTVEMAKAMIQDKQGHDPEQQVLRKNINQNELVNSNTLAYYNITSNSTLFLFKRP